MIQLVPMTQTEFDKFLAIEIEDYAQEHVKAGNWQPNQALELSRAEFAKLLPNGPASPNQYLYSIQDTDTTATVGLIWFADQQQGQTDHHHAFLYDIRIDEDQQGQGYGKAAMLAIEEKVVALGLETISLHVFGHNRVARALYENIGYEVTNVLMSKKLA